MRAGSRLVRSAAAVALATLVGLALPLAALAADTTGALVSASGEHAISVEVAITPTEREVGLMNRPSMPDDHGMLFDFGQSRSVTMWMKNTLIPLDMLFMDEAGKVTHIAADAEPQSLALIPSQGPVRYVLELNAGTAARYGLKIGDLFRYDPPAAAKP